MNYTLVMACFCIGIAIVDLKTYRIPDVLLVFFAMVMIILEGSQPYALIMARIAAAVISFLLFGTVWFFSKGIGLGDVKYAALLGYLLGPESLIQAFFITALLSIIIYLMGIILFHWPKTTKIPFAPFMSAGAIIATNLNTAGGIQ